MKYNELQNIYYIYGGRFQPPTPGHYDVFKYIVKKFGYKNCYIATSNNVDCKKNNFFSYKEKTLLWNKLFNVSKDKIILAKNPAFDPVEFLENKINAIYVSIVSEKDKNRYENSKTFTKFDESINLLPYPDHRYYFVVPMQHGNISATQIRNVLLDNDVTVEQKKAFFFNTYKTHNEQIFNFIHNKLNQSCKK